MPEVDEIGEDVGMTDDACPMLDESSQELLMSQAIMVELVKLRKKRKIGQAPIAKAIGMSQAGVSQIENLKRNVSLESVLIYAKAIGAKITIAPDDIGSKKDSKANSKGL